MAKRRLSRVEKKVVDSQIIFCCLDGMKNVSDRFLGVASELGREQLPKQQHQAYLRLIVQLLFDFPIRFSPELFSHKSMPNEWKQVATVAQRCQSELAQQYKSLSGLTTSISESMHRKRFTAASHALSPLAENLRNALLGL